MYIQFTKDINKIKNRIIFGLGLREIIIFLIILGSGFAEYHILKNYLQSDLTYYLLVPLVGIGMFFMAYKHNGMPFEKFLFYKLKRIIFSAKVKRYVTENETERSISKTLILGIPGTGKAFRADMKKMKEVKRK